MIKRFFFLMLIIISMISTVNSTLIADDIIMYYDFESDSIQENTINDQVNNWDGDIYGRVNTGQDGLIGDSFYFDGTNTELGMINISGNPLYNQQEGSFYIWFKTDGTSMDLNDDWMYVMSNNKGYDYGPNGDNHENSFANSYYWEFLLETHSNTERLSFINYNTSIGNRHNYIYDTYTDNDWHLWVVTWEGQTSNSYLDGVLVNDDITTPILFKQDNMTNTHIGHFDTNLANSFNGYIDELALFNRVITQTEITNLYNDPSNLLSNIKHSLKINIDSKTNSVSYSIVKDTYYSSGNKNIINWLILIWGDL